MRVEPADNVAHHARRLPEWSARSDPGVVHRIENAPMNRFKAIPGIRQCSSHDYAHGVIQVGLFHLVRDFAACGLHLLQAARRAAAATADAAPGRR